MGVVKEVRFHDESIGDFDPADASSLTLLSQSNNLAYIRSVCSTVRVLQVYGNISPIAQACLYPYFCNVRLLSIYHGGNLNLIALGKLVEACRHTIDSANVDISLSPALFVIEP